MSRQLPQQQPFLSIPKQELTHLDAETFHGRIDVIETEAQADNALAILEQEEMVGFDTETRPSFRKGVNYKVSLVQISTADHCFLFRINKLGVSERLRRFLENPDVVKIGLSLKDDFFVLHKIEEFEPAGFIDLQDFVADYGIADASLQKIYGIVFGRRISKSQRLSNWEAQRLTYPQQSYAALDAQACLSLYRHLTAGNFHPEESPWRIPDSPEGDDNK